MRKINVLSLCDGMSCCHIALDNAGIPIENYFAGEIKPIAIKVTMENYPNTIQIGDITKVTYKDGVLHTENGDFEIEIDLVAFGSPCQSFSVAMKTEHRIGLEDKEKSGLFLECHRILNEINPKYFFMENVASMKKEDEKVITDMMGVKPIRLDSADVAPAMRKRLYWTNLPAPKIEKKKIDLADIITDGWVDRKKARSLLVSDSRPLTTPIKMFHRYKKFNTLIFKSEEHYLACKKEYEKFGPNPKAKDLDGYTGTVFNGIRYLNQEELEKCQTVPPGYTKCLTRNEAADVLGDGWTVDIITEFFKGIE